MTGPMLDKAGIYDCGDARRKHKHFNDESPRLQQLLGENAALRSENTSMQSQLETMRDAMELGPNAIEFLNRLGERFAATFEDPNDG